MAEVYLVEMPGGAGESYQCPYCSQAFPRKDTEGREVTCPATCRRCGSPMDIDKSLEYAHRKAVEAATPTPGRNRQRVKV